MSKINYVVKCAGERLRPSVSGVYRKIAVKLAQSLKRGAKRTNITAVKVAPAVRVGKESVSADQHVLAKKARRADRTDTPKKAERERKEDTEKRKIILLLASALGCVRTEDIVNPEREFLFTWNGKKYKVVLSCPRS